MPDANGRRSATDVLIQAVEEIDESGMVDVMVLYCSKEGNYGCLSNVNLGDCILMMEATKSAILKDYTMTSDEGDEHNE
jgi:hypothetical protein